MQKIDRYDLTRGPILQKMVALALPMVGTQFVQMTYNLADMFWLGRLGSGAVAASGTAGIYMWLSVALMLFGSKGAEIGVAQRVGAGEMDTARGYAQSALSLTAVLGVLFAAGLMIFHAPLIGFFGLGDAAVEADARRYLLVVAVGVPFNYITACTAGAFNGSGNAKIPFYVNLACVLLNVVLDPLFIFTFGMGITGAALATVLAQALGAALMLLALRRSQQPVFRGFRFFALPKRSHLRNIFRWALPISVESFFFTFLSMLISRMVAAFGAGAFAAQRVGGQIEGLSWLVGIGFASAFTAFSGQNFGAGHTHRIRRGLGISSAAMGLWGVAVTALLFFGARPLMALFLPGETAVIELGATYLRILSSCQLVACLEGIGSGGWRGIGRTVPPSAISVVVNVLRVGLAWWFSSTGMGLAGIWWAVSIGALLRGLLTYGSFLFYTKSRAFKSHKNLEIITD